jgi:Carboxypeptidase regulatory-like domain
MNWKRFFAVAFVLLVVLSIGSGRLAAQTQSTGDVAGVVTDPTGAVVPDAKVELKDNAKGSIQDTMTDRNGGYRFYLLPPGSYTVTVTATGFSSQNRTSEIAVGQVITLSFALSIGSSATTVTVTEAAPLMSTDNGNVATTLSQEQVSQIPNPGNDMSYIAQMAPGSVMNTGMGYGNFSSYGTPGTSNLFTLDGMDDNDPFLNLNNSGATNLLLGANEVMEATVVDGAYTGEYGTLAGANVNYVTKSGGNDFHGNAIYYWNGRAMNADSWFNKNAGINRTFDNVNQWAASMGGPIKRDKLFFFANTEGLRVIIPTSVNTLVPSPAYQDFVTNPTTGTLHLAGLDASIPFYNQMFNLYNNAPGVANAVPFDTGTGGAPAVCLGEVTLPGNAPCILSFRGINPNFTHEWLLSGRVDYNLSSNDRLFLRTSYDHGLQATFTDTINPLFNAQSDQPQWQAQLNETHTFSSTMVNQFIASFAWYSAIFTNANRTASLAALPTTVTWDDSAFTAAGRALYDWPQGRNVTQYQFGDDLSKTINNHTIKGGIKFRRNDVSDWDYGVLTSGRAFTNLASAAAGQVDFMEQTFPSDLNNPTGIGRLRQPAALYSFAAYGEDDWRVRSNLTLTFALRAEHYSNPVCQTNCFARLTGQFNQVSHDPNQPYDQAIQTGLHQALPNLDKINWAPRFGFAWQPFGIQRNFVIRGGAGIFYDQFPGQVVDNFSQNPPLYNLFVVPGNLAPTETNGGNVYTTAAANNAAFINGFNNGSTLAQIQTAAPFFTPPGVFTADTKTHAPQYQKWSLEIQKGFGANTTLQVGYYGNHGIHELIVDPSLNAFGFGSLPAAPADTRFSEVQWANTAARSNYNGVTVSVTRRITGWGSGVLSGSYTYSHSFDEVSNGGLLPFVLSTNVSPLTPQIPGNYRNNYGPSDYDVRNYANVNYVWQVPIRRMMMGHGWAPLVDGWQISGAIFVRSGLPYTVIDGGIDGALGGNNYFSAVYPTFLGGPVPSCGTSAAFAGATGGTIGTPCLSASQFPATTTETGFGPNGLRNKFRGPGYTDTDFTIMKNTKIPHWERGQLGIGAQFFNLFNHPNFDQPVNDISSGQFGQVLNTISTPTSILGAFLGGDASPRLIQLKASLTF